MSTYNHPYGDHRNNLHHAMDYNAAGQPVVRVITTSGTATNDGRSDAFAFQLERDGLNETAITYTLAVAAAADNDDALGSVDWEELF